MTSAATIAGLLANEQRLHVFAAVALGAATIDEVAETSGLGVEVVQGVLPRLLGAGLVEQRDGLRVVQETLAEAARDRPARRRDLPGASAEQAAVLRRFVEDGRLRSIPVRASARRVVLDYLGGLFEPGREYSEQTVNETLAAFHEDHASLRRYLVDEGLLEREHGVYRRPEPLAAAAR